MILLNSNIEIFQAIEQQSCVLQSVKMLFTLFVQVLNYIPGFYTILHSRNNQIWLNELLTLVHLFSVTWGRMGPEALTSQPAPLVPNCIRVTPFRPKAWASGTRRGPRPVSEP